MNSAHPSKKLQAQVQAQVQAQAQVQVLKKRKRPSDDTTTNLRPTQHASSASTLTASASTSTSTGVCEHVTDRYEKVGRIGEGTYGIVYKALDKQTSKFVALKRCIPHHESSDGFPLTTLRELQTLRMGKGHPHIVQLLAVTVSSTNGVFLVFEYCSHDVAQLLDSYYPKRHTSPFTESQVKTITLRLLGALHFLHSRATLHRDIKPSNLLYHDGKLQLADFGLARQYSKQRLTPNVVSLWYRAPELLWHKGFTNYSAAIDMWATGCVLAELLQGFPLLDGKTEMEQMEKISSCLGTPPYPYGERLTNKKGVELWDRFETLSKEGLGLLTMLLEYGTDARWTAKQAMESAFFTVDPLPATHTTMPSFESLHQGI